MTMHKRDQWYRVYVYTPYIHKIEVRDGKPVALVDEKGEPLMHPPTWSTVEQTLHVHHPDSYHPDPRITRAHHSKHRKKSLTACGQEHPGENRFVEAHDIADRCPNCVRVTEGAKTEHVEARKQLLLHTGKTEKDFVPTEETE